VDRDDERASDDGFEGIETMTTPIALLPFSRQKRDRR
jgi:hypothetical protein